MKLSRVIHTQDWETGGKVGLSDRENDSEKEREIERKLKTILSTEP